MKKIINERLFRLLQVDKTSSQSANTAGLVIQTKVDWENAKYPIINILYGKFGSVVI